MMNISKKLIDYYFSFKDVVILHQGFKWGTSPRLPEKFTEELCRQLYSFEYPCKGIKREYDLIDTVQNIKIEVKASTDEYGRNTMNPVSRFDSLFWLYFMFEYDIIRVVKIDHKEIQKNLSPNALLKRVNVSLSKFSPYGIDYFSVDREDERVREISSEHAIGIIKNAHQ